jgi:ketosteroid isomerase-like protein
MKKLVCVVLLIGFVSLAFAQRPTEKSPLQAMVDTELAFAQLAAEKGTRDSFLAFIADDGVLFRPTAVKGKQWLRDHPAPVSDKRPLLSWYPAVAGVARAGDMGYSTGPWEFKRDTHDAQSVAWGHFLTIWKKQANGEWKFAIDLGISHSQPAQAEAAWAPAKNFKATKPSAEPAASTSSDSLLARDREFSQASIKRGAQSAFSDFAATDVRLYRDEKFPIAGRELAAVALPATPSVWSWEPAAGDVSSSDDLGYTYGTYKITSGEKVVESGNYYRVWKKDGGRWKVLFDLTNPVAPAAP